MIFLLFISLIRSVLCMYVLNVTLINIFFSQQHIRFHLRKNAPLTKKIIEKPQPFTQGENLKTSFYDTYMHRRVIGWHKKHIEIECFEMLRR